MAVLRPRPPRNGHPHLASPLIHSTLKRKRKPAEQKKQSRGVPKQTTVDMAALRNRDPMQQHSPLFRLPLELRQEIFKYLMCGLVGVLVDMYVDNESWPRPRRTGFSWGLARRCVSRYTASISSSKHNETWSEGMNLALLRTCTQAYQDAWNLHLSGNIFELDQLQMATQFLGGCDVASLHPYQAEALRHLVLRYDVHQRDMLDTSHPRRRICLPELRTLDLVQRYSCPKAGAWLAEMAEQIWGVAFVILAPRTDLVVRMDLPKDICGHEEAVATCLKEHVSCEIQQHELSILEALKEKVQEPRCATEAHQVGDV